MPLHVDRTSVQTHQSRGEHVLELAAARARQAAAGPDAAKPQDDASPVLRLVGVTTPDTGDVDSIEQAEQLVRSLFGWRCRQGARRARWARPRPRQRAPRGLARDSGTAPRLICDGRPA